MALRARFAMLAALALALALGTVLVRPAAGAPPPATPQMLPAPQVWPVPQSITARSGQVDVPPTVRLVNDADAGTAAVATQALQRAGARRITPAGDPGLTVYLGGAKARAALRKLDVKPPDGLPAGGYALGIGGGIIALAGVDADGTYYAAQTLRQLVRGDSFPAVAIRDWPKVALRGVVEGFYGAPWSEADRLAQLDFAGRTKQNVYVYSPKDDPYLRQQWRDPYPPDRLAGLRRLVARAQYDHVRFTYALSPGLSVCYSSDSDEHALVAKLQSLYDIGVRSFTVPLDDITYTQWNCAADQQRFGTGPAAAGAAQAFLLDRVQHDFAAARPGLAPLQIVPTEYSDIADSRYKQALRERLDPHVVVEWTGVGVVAHTIGAAQAAAAQQVYGHRILIWDNFPVNDFQTDRLFLGPYLGREPGITDHIVGMTVNPMVQAAPSQVGEFSTAAFLWNPAGYDPDATWRAAIRAVGGPAAGALQVLADNSASSRLQRIGANVPDAEATPLRSLIAAYRGGTDSAGLAAYFERMAAAPAQLQAADPVLAHESAPWLQVLSAYGRAGQHTLRLVQGERDGDQNVAMRERQAVLAALGQAHAVTVQTASGTVRPSVAGGVLEPFVQQALAADTQQLSTFAELAARVPLRSCVVTLPRCVLT